MHCKQCGQDWTAPPAEFPRCQPAPSGGVATLAATAPAPSIYQQRRRDERVRLRVVATARRVGERQQREWGLPSVSSASSAGSR